MDELSASESSVSNPATDCAVASHRGEESIISRSYLVLPKYTRYTRAHTHNSPPSCPIPLQRILHFFLSPPLFNILAQYRRVALGLHVQVGPLDCSPGLLGREEVEVEGGGSEKIGDDGRKAHNNSLFPRMSGPAA